MSKRKHRGFSLVYLEEVAKRLTRDALTAYVVPMGMRETLVLGVLFEEDDRVFELYVPGNTPSEAHVITRIRINSLTGEPVGETEVYELTKKNAAEDLGR